LINNLSNKEKTIIVPANFFFIHVAIAWCLITFYKGWENAKIVLVADSNDLPKVPKPNMAIGFFTRKNSPLSFRNTVKTYAPKEALQILSPLVRYIDSIANKDENLAFVHPNNQEELEVVRSQSFYSLGQGALLCCKGHELVAFRFLLCAFDCHYAELRQRHLTSRNIQRGVGMQFFPGNKVVLIKNPRSEFYRRELKDDGYKVIIAVYDIDSNTHNVAISVSRKTKLDLHDRNIKDFLAEANEDHLWFHHYESGDLIFNGKRNKAGKTKVNFESFAALVNQLI